MINLEQFYDLWNEEIVELQTNFGCEHRTYKCGQESDFKEIPEEVDKELNLITFTELQGEIEQMKNFYRTNEKLKIWN